MSEIITASELITAYGVTGFIDRSGTAQLCIEDVARGLGFTQNKGGVEYVRWETVNGYLSEFGVSQLVGKDYIPENVFYRLAMKARNETAEKFQALVADEILPSIRQHGAYMTPDTIEKVLADPDTIIQLATRLKEHRAEIAAQDSYIKTLEPKAEFFDAVAGSRDAISIGDAAKVLDMGVGQNRLFDVLRREQILQDNNIPYQIYIDRGYFRVVEQKFVAKGETRISIKTLVSQRGLDYIRKMLQKRMVS